MIEERQRPEDMAMTRNFIPFNKDQASVAQAKQALQDIELLFDLVQRGQSDAIVGAHVARMREAWETKYAGTGV